MSQVSDSHRIFGAARVQNTDLVTSREDLVFERVGRFVNDQKPKKGSEKTFRYLISIQVPL